MKVIVKTLNGKQLPIEIEPAWTVRQIKEQIEKDHKMVADTLKLIAYGKVLDSDDKFASDYNIKENDFIVAMVQKAKPAPKVAAPPKVEDVKMEEPAQETQQQNPTEAPKVETTVTQPPTQPPAQQQPANPVPQQEMTAELTEAVTLLMEITGKSHEQCLKAMQIAQNTDLAAELLINGVNLDQQVPEYGQEQLGDHEDQEVEGDGLDAYNLSPEVRQAIHSLVTNPSFPQIRMRMIQDPNFSAQFMSQLQQTQPQVFQAIQANPGILMHLIMGHDPMAGGMQQQQQQQQPPPGSISVSPEEMEAINRLTSLGFSKQRAAEAYFACDKNEEMAANFLFEAGAEDEDVATQNAIAASQAVQQPPNAQPAEAQQEQQQQPNAEQQQEQQPDQNNNNQQPPKDDNNESGDPNAGGEGGGQGSSLA